MQNNLGDWRRTHYSNMVTAELDGRKVTVFGWIEDIRDLGGLIFLTLRDRGGFVQVTVSRKAASKEVLSRIGELGRQSAVGVRGVVKARAESPRGVEIVPEEVKILGGAVHPLPLDPTGRVPADPDVRFDSRVLDLRRVEQRAMFIVRHEVLREIRSFLAGRGFVEIHTPKIIATATEGGANLFPVDYFEGKAYLAQSPQLYKEELVTVFEKVFEVGPVFRAEPSHTRRHVTEFTSVDIEEAFVTGEDIMKIQEELVQSVIQHVQGSCQPQLEILGAKPDMLKLPLKRYSYKKVLDELAGCGVEVPWGEDIPTPALRELSMLHRKEYYFIVDWPTKAKVFYIKPREDNPELCYAFDFMYEWIEVSSGGTRVDSKEILVSRLREQGLNPDDFKHHLNVFDWGMPPHAGFGLGLERLLMAVTGVENIMECILFPRSRTRLYP